MSRRLWSFVVVLSLVVMFVGTAHGAAAQDTEPGATAPVTIHLFTCDVTGSANSVALQASSTPPRVLRNCAEGAAGLEQILQIDGVGPDSFTANEAVWNAVSLGDHTAIASGMQGTVFFSLGEDGIELWAFLARHADPVPGTGTIVANLRTCDVAGTADSVSLSVTDAVPPVLTNCRKGWAGSAGFLTVDGLAPDTYDANVAIWYDMPFGDYTASAGGMGDEILFTLSGDTSYFWATWDKHVVPGGSVNVSVYACDSATGPQSWIGLASDVPDSFVGCAPANIDSREWGLRLDGSRPDFFQSNQATWLPYNGTHVVTTSSGASYDVSVAGGNTELVAYFGPEGAVSGVADATVTPDASVTPAPSLPNTGVGAETANGTPMAALLVASLAMLTLAVAGGLLRRTDRS